MANKKIKQIRLQGETYDIALDSIDQVEGLTDELSTFTKVSVLPNDTDEIKTKFRLSLKDFTSESTSATRYYKLVTFPINNTTNYASLVLSGRIGGWNSDSFALVDALIWNKGTPGMSLINIASSNVTSVSNIWNYCDLELYVANATNPKAEAIATLYIKCYSYFAFDLDVELLQSTATIDYNGTYSTTVPSGILAAKASTSTNKLDIASGKLLINGNSTMTGSWNSTTGVLTINTNNL